MKYENVKLGQKVEVKATGRAGKICHIHNSLHAHHLAKPWVQVEFHGPVFRNYRARELRLVESPMRIENTHAHEVMEGYVARAQAASLQPWEEALLSVEAMEREAAKQLEAVASLDIHGLLEQAYGWVQRDGTPIRLMEMSVPHKLNALALLERRAEKLAMARMWRNVGFPDLPDEVGSDLADATLRPLEWIRRTPLYREMLRQVNAGIGAKDKPDAERFPLPGYQI